MKHWLPFCCLLSAGLHGQGMPESISGAWVNAESKSGGITHVTVRREGTRTLVHVWGRCTPTDCDWGEAEAELWNGTPLVIWKMGFSTVRMQVIPTPDGRLLVTSRGEFNDNSGRTDPGHAEFFNRRAEPKDDPTAAEARAVLRQVAERYRTLPPAYFESVMTRTRKTERSEARRVIRTKVHYLAANKVRLEIDDGHEARVELMDGAQEWQIYPAANEYRVAPQAKSLRLDLIEYARIDQTPGALKVIGHQRVEGVEATGILIELDRGVVEMYWVEDETHLIRKMTQDDGPDFHEELSYTTARLGEKPREDLFTYDPAAAHAKNRRELAHAAPIEWTGRIAPEFSLKDLEGREIRLSQLRGKVVLLDFWGTWCGFCRAALPGVEMLHRGLKDKGLVVLGVDNESPELARDYVAKQHYTFPTLVDDKETVVGLFHVGEWPTTIVIDREGKVVYYATDEDGQKLRDVLKSLEVW